MLKAGTQAGMALQKRMQPPLSSSSHPAPLELELELHRIDVGTLRIVERMEQQALLQGRQRQDVLERRDTRSPAARSRPATALPAAGRWGSAAGARPRRMAHQSPQRLKPHLRQLRDVASPRPAPGPRPGGAQPGPSGPSRVTRIDLERMGERHRRHPRRPCLGRLPPCQAPDHRKPSQIVEAKLRRRKPRQPAPVSALRWRSTP